MLLAHPAVAEAVCFGVPHATWGEEVAAAVVVLRSERSATRAELLAYCSERLADYKRPKQIHITDAIPRTATGKIQRARRREGVRSRRALVKIVIAGAGAIGGYIGARLAQAGADVVLFARGPHLRAMQERGLRVISPDGDFEVRPQVDRRSLGAIGTADVVFLGVKAHGLTALAPQLRPLFGPDTVVVSTQNGIPWWYFQGYGGELDGLRLERVDPGGVIAVGHRAAARRRVARVLCDRHRRAGRHSPHRRQPHQLRRAGRHEVGSVRGDRGAADRRRASAARSRRGSATRSG